MVGKEGSGVSTAPELCFAVMRSLSMITDGSAAVSPNLLISLSNGGTERKRQSTLLQTIKA